MNKDEVYISVDIEADGPIPGINSMLSFGAAAFTADGTMLGTFEANLYTMPSAKADEDTTKWWETQPEAWAACRKNLQEPRDAIYDFVVWVERLPGNPVFVGYPVAYDFTFLYWYMIYFVGRSPFSHSGLDIKTLAMVLLGKGYRASTKKSWPKRWFEKTPHSHIAVDDAIEQGRSFILMLKEARNLLKEKE